MRCPLITCTCTVLYMYSIVHVHYTTYNDIMSHVHLYKSQNVIVVLHVSACLYSCSQSTDHVFTIVPDGNACLHDIVSVSQSSPPGPRRGPAVTPQTHSDPSGSGLGSQMFPVKTAYMYMYTIIHVSGVAS